jgi:heme-degrading monooxygenase HmoA
MIIQIVRFKSGLTEEQIVQKYNARAPRYRELKGLKQKYYLKFPETNEYGAVYLWETESALKEFRESELGQTISTSYKIQGDTDVQMAEMIMTLR